MSAEHRTFPALNTRIEILGVEYRYFCVVALVFMAGLLTRGATLSTFIAPGAVWLIGAGLYAMNPQWLGVLILRVKPNNWHRRYSARRRA